MASVIDKMTRDQPNLRLSFKPATLLLRLVRVRHHRLLNGGDGIDGDGHQHPHCW